MERVVCFGIFLIFRDGALSYCGLHLFKSFVSALAQGDVIGTSYCEVVRPGGSHGNILAA
jgi:hypothetical protein